MDAGIASAGLHGCVLEGRHQIVWCVCPWCGGRGGAEWVFGTCEHCEVVMGGGCWDMMTVEG